MPFESKLIGFKSLLFNVSVLFQRFIYLFIWEELYVYVTLFSLSLPFFFFGGGLSLWKNLCNTIILQLCFVHLFVPSGNWQALNIICGLVVMEFAYVLLFDLEMFLFLFSWDIAVDYVVVCQKQLCPFFWPLRILLVTNWTMCIFSL